MNNIEEIVHAFRVNTHSELEAVFHLQPTVPRTRAPARGIGFVQFKGIFDVLERSASHGIFVKTPKQEIIDFLYDKSVRGRYHCNGTTPAKYVQKTPLSRVALMSTQRPGILVNMNLKEELPITKKNWPATSPLMVRFQTVWSYTYKNLFMFDLKKTVTGKTKVDACKQAPHYEVEIELMRTKDILDRNNDTVIAASMMEKIIDLMGRYDTTTGEKVDVTLFPVPRLGHKYYTEGGCTGTAKDVKAGKKTQEKKNHAKHHPQKEKKKHAKQQPQK